MAFKTDSIKLKNYADSSARNAAIASPAGGDIAVNAGALQFYNGTTWKSIDTSPSNSNIVRTATWTGDVTLSDGVDIESLVYYNKVTAGVHQLKIPNVGSYSSNAKLEIINGTNTQLQLGKEDAADPHFLSSGSQVTTIEIGPGQRALLLKTTTTYWEVIVLTL